MRAARRLAGAAVAAVLLSSSAPAPGGEAEAGPAAVLSLLQEVSHGRTAPHESTSKFLEFGPRREEVPESAGPRIVTSMPPGCGMVELERLPLDRARSLLRRLFRLHGIEADGPHPLATGNVKAVVDGFDPGRKAGFKFVRAKVPSWKGWSAGPDPAPDEPADRALDPAEIRALRDDGYRILPVPVDRYWGNQRDSFTPLFTCLLDAVAFLGEGTRGDGLDIRFLAGAGSREIPLPDFDDVAFAGNPRFVPSRQTHFLLLESAKTLRLDVRPPAIPGERGIAPTLLVLPFHWLPPYRDGGYDFSGPAPTFTLTQEGGKETLTIRSGRALFVLPGAFDPQRPFRVSVDLPPGQANLGRALVLRHPGNR